MLFVVLPIVLLTALLFALLIILVIVLLVILPIVLLIVLFIVLLLVLFIIVPITLQVLLLTLLPLLPHCYAANCIRSASRGAIVDSHVGEIIEEVVVGSLWCDNSAVAVGIVVIIMPCSCYFECCLPMLKVGAAEQVGKTTVKLVFLALVAF